MISTRKVLNKASSISKGRDSFQRGIVSKVVIFCESYPQIKNALYVATHNCHDNSITLVIPGNHDLLKFFQVINERVFRNAINIIYFQPYQARRVTAKGIKKVFHVLPDIIKERRYLKGIYNKYFAELKGAEIFFSDRYWNPYTFYLLKKLSKTIRLVYIPDPAHDVLPIDKFAPTNIVDLVSLIILKLIYGWDMTMGKLLNMKLPYMSDKFFNREVDKVIDREERDEMMKNFDLSQFKIFDVGNYSVIYFDDGLIASGYVTDKNTFRRELTNIFNILGKYFPEKKIALKYHPRHNSDKSMIEIGDVLPDFIPAEFLYNNNIKMYISFFSLSIANVEKGLAVSIADLISFKSDESRNQLKEILIQRSRSEILFPQSLDEFERILIDLKGRTV